MKHREVISVDLGSAYTKIGVRTDWDVESHLLRDIPVASKDTSFCIPSVVARVRNGGRDDWLIGVAAGSQVPGDGVTIFRNWKAGLFSANPSGAHSVTTPVSATSLGNRESADVALHFFRALSSYVRSAVVARYSDAMPIRVSIPCLAGSDEAGRVLLQLVAEAGWVLASPRPTLYEPESNALGVLSRGRNWTWFPRWSDRRNVYLPSMLEPGLMNAFHNMQDYYGVLFTDIGAFTTDFGYVRFDCSFRKEWQFSTVIQHSVELGIHELDDEVRSQLRPESQAAIRSAPHRDWEAAKVALYSGQTAAFRNPGGGVVVVGEDGERETIGQALRSFAERVWQARADFVASRLSERAHMEMLTGGGVLIPLVRSQLVDRMRKAGGVFVRDLLDDEGERMRRRAVPLDTHLRQNRDLIRGGSAIGGASVFFE